MVRIRLRRIGLKGQPTYRIIAADKESPRDGRFLEILGVYNPRTNPATIHIKEDPVFHWMKNGALPPPLKSPESINIPPTLAAPRPKGRGASLPPLGGGKGWG